MYIEFIAVLKVLSFYIDEKGVHMCVPKVLKVECHR